MSQPMNAGPAAAPIVVENLSKTYRVPEREGGFAASVRSLFKRTCAC